MGKSWSLGWEGRSFATVESGAPSASLAHSSASAFPGLNALLGSLPVVGLGDGAVVIMGSRFLVRGPVSLVEHLGVIEVEEVELILTGWDISGLEGTEDSNGDEFHINNFKYYNRSPLY